MCGIFGFNWEDKQLLSKGLSLIAHRGPDGRGTYTDNRVSLGHNRLAIIDLSKKGLQPMCSHDELVWVTFNGEIYNYLPLKKELEKKYSFRTNTDTEVLLYLYKEYGPRMLSKIEGMFAFCIYDKKNKKLFLARDRPGIKPLYYASLGNRFLFASEIKALFAHKDLPRELEKDCLETYFTFRANTLSKTFFKHIFKLEAGTSLVYDLISHRKESIRYWDYPSHIPSTKTTSSSIAELIDESVKSQLMSDVPYGVFLSGGIDSGIVASLVSKHSPQPAKTFSVGFGGIPGETEKAQALATAIGAEHHSLNIDKSAIKYYPSIIHHADEPLADPTVIPTYLLSRYAKKHCTVILTGEGADEVFGGYPQYRFMKLNHEFLGKLPTAGRSLANFFVRKSPGVLLNKVFPYASALGEEGKERFSRFIHAKTLAEQYLQQVAIFNNSEQENLFSLKKDLYAAYQKKYFAHAQKGYLLHSLQKLDFKEPMVDDLLMKLDKNTMAFSIEGRVPFLDTSVIERGATLPDRLKMSLLKEKIMLREASRDLLPRETNQRKKRHFFVPIDAWIKEDLATLSEKVLSHPFLKKQAIFNETYIQKMLQNFKTSPLFYARQLWTLMTFQLWYQRFINDEKITL